MVTIILECKKCNRRVEIDLDNPKELAKTLTISCTYCDIPMDKVIK